MMTLWDFGLVHSDDISTCLAVVDRYALKRSTEAGVVVATNIMNTTPRSRSESDTNTTDGGRNHATMSRLSSSSSSSRAK